MKYVQISVILCCLSISATIYTSIIWYWTIFYKYENNTSIFTNASLILKMSKFICHTESMMQQIWFLDIFPRHFSSFQALNILALMASNSAYFKHIYFYKKQNYLPIKQDHFKLKLEKDGLVSHKGICKIHELW